jgi:glutathione S-transferase
LLTFVSSEIHKSLSPLFNSAITEDVRAGYVEKLNKRLPFIEETLSKNIFVTGDTFTIADAYLFTVLNWTTYLKVDISKYPNILAFMERVKTRPQVQEALKSEGII